MDWKCTEEAMIHLMASSWLCWDWPDLSLSTTNVPIKNLYPSANSHRSLFVHVASCRSSQHWEQATCLSCAKLKLGFTVESLTHFLNGLLLTRAYGPYIWAECDKQASKCHGCYHHLLCNIYRNLA